MSDLVHVIEHDGSEWYEKPGVDAAIVELESERDDWRMSFKGEEMRAEQAEAEREAIAKSLQACGNYTGYTMYVEQRDRADRAESEVQRILHVIDTAIHELGGPSQLAKSDYGLWSARAEEGR